MDLSRGAQSKAWLSAFAIGREPEKSRGKADIAAIEEAISDGYRIRLCLPRDKFHSNNSEVQQEKNK